MTDGVSRETHLSIAASSMFPGFKFCPTDKELISYYLRQKLDGHQDTVQLIPEVEICRFEPWELPAKSSIKSDNEWFFFSPRGRKYPNGSQSKRATECGYWKATGKERNVKSGSDVIGTKRTLVFHRGRAPKGERTEWIMHEYCINDKLQDSLVVCRLKKNTEFRLNDASNRASSNQMQAANSHESSCDICETGIDQVGVCEQDKGVGCSPKLSGGSYTSPSVEQVDSVSESSHRPANDTTLIESSSHQKEVDEEDWYADILKNDIINLDESSLSPVAYTRLQDPPCETLPFQGTAQRRIRLWVDKPRHNYSSARVRFPSSKNSSKNALFARMSSPRLMLFVLFILTSIAVLLVVFIGLGNL